jgi:hypothetical protein
VYVSLYRPITAKFTQTHGWDHDANVRSSFTMKTRPLKNTQTLSRNQKTCTPPPPGFVDFQHRFPHSQSTRLAGSSNPVAALAPCRPSFLDFKLAAGTYSENETDCRIKCTAARSLSKIVAHSQALLLQAFALWIRRCKV